jgi:hypothetical protein
VNYPLPKADQFDKSTMVTIRSDDPDELIKQIGRLPDILVAVADAKTAIDAIEAIQEAFPDPEPPPAPVATPANVTQMPQAQEQAQQTMVAQGAFDICPIHNIPKDRWVPAGVSKAGRRYQGFYGCSVQGCRGR